MTQYVSAEVVVMMAEAAGEEVTQHVMSQLRVSGFVVLGDCTHAIGGSRFFIVTASRDVVERTAERHRFVKPLVHGKVVAPSGHTAGSDEDDYLEYIRDKGDVLFQNHRKPGFFDKAETAELVLLALNDVKLNAAGTALVVKELAAQEAKEAGGGKAKAQDECKLTVDTLFPALRVAGLLDSVVPLHEPGERDAVWKKSKLSLLAPIEYIAGYYGSKVAFYYAWLNSFTMWLAVPAVVGFVLFAQMQLTDYTVDDDPYMPFYSFFMVVWACAFLKNWDRDSQRWAFRWRVVGLESREEVRPGFKGSLQRCRRTGGVEVTYPTTRRLKAYALSAIVTVLMLLVAFKVMVLSLNLQGYIDGQIYLERPLFYPSLSQYAAKGAIFDPNQEEYFGLIALVPTMMHVVVIMTLNNFYRQVAEWLTQRENHRTEEEHDRSLIVKRFLFESFDCYISLFYLGFVQQDVTKLRTELISLYTVDSLRRVFCEVLLPSVVNLYEKKTFARQFAEAELAASTASPTSKARWENEKGSLCAAYTEVNQDEHELFDDYLEMVIEFGYVVLFASAFPLASLLSLLCNVVEMKSDMFKMTRVLRRPIPSRAPDMGVWRDLLQVMMWLAIFTNTYLFVSSEQLAAWLPSLYRHATEKDVMRGIVEADDLADDVVVKKGKVRWVLIIAALIERFFFIVCVGIQKLVSSTPEDVRIELERMKYVREQYLVRTAKEREAASHGRDGVDMRNNVSEVAE